MRVAAALARLLAAPIAHRGLHACGGVGPVENSLSAAQAAIAGGYGIECDIRLSRDGEAMVFHDEGLERLTGVDRRLADVDAADLATLRLRGGADAIPTLDDFLATIAGRTPLVIEIKRDGDDDMRLAERVLALVQAWHGVVALESFDPDVVLHCRRANPACPIGLVGPVDAEKEPDSRALAASDFVSWRVDCLAAIVDRCPHLPRSAWTVRNQEQRVAAERYGAQVVFEGWRPPNPSMSTPMRRRS